MIVLITGGTGLVGSALHKVFTNTDYECVFLSSKDYDLTVYNECQMCFEKYKPDIVIHLAANVGGLFKNMIHKVDILESNLLININVLKCCYDFNVKKCISCLSTCIFPNKTTYPIM